MSFSTENSNQGFINSFQFIPCLKYSNKYTLRSLFFFTNLFQICKNYTERQSTKLSEQEEQKKKQKLPTGSKEQLVFAIFQTFLPRRLLSKIIIL